ncbi:transcription initiation factor TFIID subunit 12-like [Enoplosus armatus]|uniref:transcription initiation factor TFIID subunit 12-like n=1 Tax=Enoplosus armatus TaxID=215367 RepID=UPI00399360AE
MAQFDVIYREAFGPQFVRTFVREFRRGSALTRVNATTADVAIVFNRTTPTAELPQNSAVSKALFEAVNNSTNNFNVSINPATITVEGPLPAAITTVAPTTVAPATAKPTTAKPTTAAATTVALITRSVTFRSLQSTFTSDLLNSSSAAFRNRASMIKTQLEPVYQRAFPSSFKFLKVVSFSNGSVITTMDLSFDSTSVPNNTQIANVLISAASNVTGFDIEGSSVTVNGTTSSGVSHKISLFTASCLVLLSWLLSSQQ